MSDARSPWLLLTSLWVTQFIGIGFLTVGLASILREDGASLSTLASLSLVGLLWPLKVLWAPLVDRVGSRRLGHHRRRAGRVPAAPRGPWPRQRHPGRASYIGTMLGGGLCVLVYDRLGWTAAVLLLAALTLSALGVVIGFREPGGTVHVPAAAAWGELVSVFRRSGVPRWALVAVPLVDGGASGVYALTGPALVDAGWSLTRVGIVTGAVALVASTLGFVPLLVGSAPLLGTVAALSGVLVAYTAPNVVIYTVTMDLARPETAGTDFTTLTRSRCSWPS